MSRHFLGTGESRLVFFATVAVKSRARDAPNCDLDGRFRGNVDAIYASFLAAMESSFRFVVNVDIVCATFIILWRDLW